MSDEGLNDDERKQLYLSLLRGMAQMCQDDLCAQDLQHDWSHWTRYVIQPDTPIGPIKAYGEIEDSTYRVAARRQCLNCGKEQFDG